MEKDPPRSAPVPLARKRTDARIDCIESSLIGTTTLTDIGTGSLHLRVPPAESRGNTATTDNPMRTSSLPPARNYLLASLPRTDAQQVADELEEVPLAYGDILYEPGRAIRHVYFPNDSLVSLLTLVDQHQALEVGLVGREGMVGLPLALEKKDSPVRALVQGRGTAMRMTSASFTRLLRQSSAMQRLMRVYTAELMAQITQTAGCNRFHVIEARLARWLLMTHDRLGVNPFHLTQEFLSHMLGVRRVGVTNAASALQKAKLIGYSRGNITILDRKGLEAASCTCYRMARGLSGSSRSYSRLTTP